MSDSQLLHAISGLSREFGGTAYVRGGGGNTSCKNASTLWIKPSGLSLADMNPAAFVALSRDKIDMLYDARLPGGEKEREAAVKDFMAESVLPGQKGRPSVEAPLHNAFPQRFVVHTHPALVNGMTCGRDGEEACARLFPNALWMPFIEPGYTLSVRVRKEILAYVAKHGKAPEMLFLCNHGLFIAHDSEDGIRALYHEALAKTAAEIEKAGLRGDPDKKPNPGPATVSDLAKAVRKTLGDDAAEIAASGCFQVPEGVISPDHMVYCRAHVFVGSPEPDSLQGFRKQYGYWPRVVATRDGVFGFGSSRKVADLALELAWDGAQVERYAAAFGGIKYLDKAAVDFIENWEVESYRQKMTQ